MIVRSSIQFLKTLQAMIDAIFLGTEFSGVYLQSYRMQLCFLKNSHNPPLLNQTIDVVLETTKVIDTSKLSMLNFVPNALECIYQTMLQYSDDFSMEKLILLDEGITSFLVGCQRILNHDIVYHLIQYTKDFDTLRITKFAQYVLSIERRLESVKVESELSHLKEPLLDTIRLFHHTNTYQPMDTFYLNQFKDYTARLNNARNSYYQLRERFDLQILDEQNEALLFKLVDASGVEDLEVIGATLIGLQPVIQRLKQRLQSDISSKEKISKSLSEWEILLKELEKRTQSTPSTPIDLSNQTDPRDIKLKGPVIRLMGIGTPEEMAKKFPYSPVKNLYGNAHDLIEQFKRAQTTFN